MREPTKCDYVYVDDNNGVHILVPIVGGTTVGLDNTCRLRSEITTFVNGSIDDKGRRRDSIRRVLENYAQALKADIQELRGDATAAQLLDLKQERLTQINGYLEILSGTLLSSAHSLFNEMVANCKTNAVSIQLRPTNIDSCTHLNNPVFKLLRGRNNSPDWLGRVNFNETLKKAFLRSNTREDARTKVLNKVVAQTGARLRGEALLAHIQSIMPAILRECHKEVVDVTKPIHETAEADTINYQYLSQFIGSVDADTSPREMAGELLSACVVDEYWDTNSPFNDMERVQPGQKKNYEDMHQSLSLKVQFFIGQACAYAHAHGLTDKRNAGDEIEAHGNNLKETFATAAANAWSSGASVESALHDVISKNHRLLGFRSALTKKQQGEINTLFSANYNTIKGINHKDEFLLFMPGAPGNVVNHHNRISMHLMDALTQNVLNRLPTYERRNYDNHLNRWLRQRYQYFKRVQGQILPVSNEANLGKLEELANVEPLSVFTRQLDQLDLNGLRGANTPAQIRMLTEQLNAQVEIASRGVVRRSEQSQLRQACQTKRDEIQHLANDRRARLERQVKEQAAAAIRQRFVELENQSEAREADINAANNTYELSRVVARHLQQIPSDLEISHIDPEWRRELEMSSEIMRAVINSLQDAKTEALNPTLRLERALNSIDFIGLLTCDTEEALGPIRMVLETQLQELTDKAGKLGDAGRQFVEQVEQTRHNIERLIVQRRLEIQKEAKMAADKVKVQAVIGTLNNISLHVTARDSKTELKDKLTIANTALDSVFMKAKNDLEGVDLSDLEYEIAMKKGLFASEVEQKQQAILNKERVEAHRVSLCHEVSLLSAHALNQTQTLKDFFAEKQALTLETRRLEKEADILPEAAKTTVFTAIQQKNRELEQAIKVKEQTPTMASQLDRLNQRFQAIGSVISAQIKKIEKEDQGTWYALFNAKSADKANAMQNAINRIANACLIAKYGDVSHKGQAWKDALLTTVTKSSEFKQSILAAWDDPSSELYLALNTKRLSFWGHSFTLFSGQSWSHCMDGDSATVKAIKAVDTFKVENSNTGPSL